VTPASHVWSKPLASGRPGRRTKRTKGQIGGFGSREKSETKKGVKLVRFLTMLQSKKNIYKLSPFSRTQTTQMLKNRFPSFCHATRYIRCINTKRVIVKTDGSFPFEESSFCHKNWALEEYVPGGVLCLTSDTLPWIVSALPPVKPPPVTKNERKQKSGDFWRCFKKKWIHSEGLDLSKVVGARTRGAVQVMVETILGKVDTNEAPVGHHVGTVFKDPMNEPPGGHGIRDDLEPARLFLT
jgi:hypothetical protein